MVQPMEHIFKDLGKPPYSLIGFVDASEAYDAETNPKPGSSCDHCWTYITNIFSCRSSDGKEFILGSTCVDKLGDAGLKKAVNQEIKKRNQEKRRIKEAAAWEAARPEREKFEAEEKARMEIAAKERDAHNLAEYERISERLKSQPHPNAFFARKGKTMFDYLMFFWVNPSYSLCDTATMIRRNFKVTQILIAAGADIQF